jgi:4-hydroxybenzoate polyprenyltransferase
MEKIKALIGVTRPHQWYKNLIIFIGLIFSGQFFILDSVIKALFAFVILSIYSGISYIINDLVDIKSDQHHPLKKNRPLASGKISRTEALLFSVVLFVAATLWSFSINFLFGIGSISFLIAGLTYTFASKKIFLVDIINISIDFTLRAILGAIVISVFVSPWLILCTFLLALFLSLGKRRGELNSMGEDAPNHRRVLEHYSNELVDSLIIFSLSALFISYSIYSIIVSGNPFMMTTIPVATYLLFRYFFFIKSGHLISENPEKVFNDRGMMLGILLWIILVMVPLYGL